MKRSRRDFLKTAAAGGAVVTLPATSASARNLHALSSTKIAALFEKLPGDVAFKILVPERSRQKSVRRRARSGPNALRR